MDKETCRRLLQTGLDQRAYPPRLELPENDLNSISALFERPYVVWVPESVRPNRRPKCIAKGCMCTPGIKEYARRVVDDVNHSTCLLYVKYRCAGGSNIVFSTKSNKFLSSVDDETRLLFPYILKEKGGLSTALFELVHDGIMSADGLQRTRSNVDGRRQSRYYHLRSLFAARLKQQQAAGKLLLAPTAPTIEEYSKNHLTPSHQALTKAWLQETAILRTLGGQLMRNLSIKRVLRIDHSRKLCKMRCHMKDPRQGQQEMHWLLLVQNEAGQIVARSLTRSENSEETKLLLEREIKNRIPVSVVPDDVGVACGMVNDVFGPGVCVKQDPFHVIQRLSEKIKDRGLRKVFCKAIHDALYVGDALRSPIEAAAAVRDVCTKFVPAGNSSSIVRSTDAEWEGCVESNVRQILRGDLYVNNNRYCEGSGATTVVPTSQLESVHAQLKHLVNRSVSYEVGLQVLDIFLLEHNIRAGAKFGRNPAMGSLDLLSLCRAAVYCHGTIAESPQLQFALSCLSTEMAAPLHHYMSVHDFPFAQSNALFQSVRPSNQVMEERLHNKQDYAQDIRRLLQRPSIEGGQICMSRFFDSLRALAANVDVASPLSHHEYELLRQIRLDQTLRGNKSWATCPFVTTLLFNIAAASGESARFNLRQRSIQTLAKHIAAVDARLTKSSQSQRKPLFEFRQKPTCDETETFHETMLLSELFKNLRAGATKRHIIDQFVRVYDFASSVIDAIQPKSEAVVRRRWEALRKVEKRSSTTLRFPSQSAKRALQQQNGSPSSSDPEDSAVGTGEHDDDADTGEAAASTAVHGGEASQPTLIQCSSSHEPSDHEDVTNHQLICRSGTTATAGCEIITANDLQLVAQQSDAIGKGVRGKWESIADWYATLKPNSQLTATQLRHRVKRLKKRKHDDRGTAEPRRNAASLPPTTKACASCQQKKRRCGPLSTNRACERRMSTSGNQQSISSSVI